MRSSGHPLGRGALGGVLAALLVAFAAACGTDSVEPIVFEVIEVIEDVEFAASLGIDLGVMTETPHLPSVWIQDLAIGTGDTAIVGDSIFAQYTGWLRDGVEFDTGSLSYEFGSFGVIFGFQIGMEGQQVGGTRLMVIPPEWGYGSQSVGPIYGGAVLIFEVQLDSIHAAPVP
jgi:FKBP-type peptidyl-prolyl cis-trans isomerase FkpA